MTLTRLHSLGTCIRLAGQGLAIAGTAIVLITGTALCLAAVDSVVTNMSAAPDARAPVTTSLARPFSTTEMQIREDRAHNARLLMAAVQQANTRYRDSLK
ncbi:MAG: hypothetical protein HN712_00660 [Gemmatimonadetes bacterium]|nr:hypothetical protein [Gemmatimonadota bacterium]MBT6148334.1 hypothetical protein [Gemmatimonadota bacterium]MBT7858780.1 hypothetical protein [Gemmatimonadota bacterium]